MRPSRKLSIGIKWLIKYSRARAGKGMADKLAAEVIAAAKGEGAAVKKKKILIKWLNQTEPLRILKFNIQE